MWYIYTMQYYSAIKKNKTMPVAATWMDLEIVRLSEVSQIQKDNYHMILLICGIYKKGGYKWTYLQNRSSVMDVENERLPGDKGRGRDKLGDWDWYIHTTIYKIDNL